MNCYEKLNLWLSEDNSLYEDCKNFNYNTVDEEICGRDTILRAPPSREHFKKEFQLVEVMKKFGLLNAQIFLLEPNTVYNWHVDAFRYFALNCLLTDSDDYLTIFINDPTQASRAYQNFPIKRLKYESRRFYMINGLVPHFVANYSDQPRHLLTINKRADVRTSINNDFSHFLNMVKDLDEMGLIDNSENAHCNTNI